MSQSSFRGRAVDRDFKQRRTELRQSLWAMAEEIKAIFQSPTAQVLSNPESATRADLIHKDDPQYGPILMSRERGSEVNPRG